jgi:S-adenosylmethionine decarboxylase
MIEHKTEATHFVADFFDIKFPELLDDMDFCLKTVKDAIEAAGCGILNIHTHKFQPQGISINATLSESHCAIHTWPEKGYCAIDLYGCGRAELHKGIDIFIERFQPGNTKIVKLSRGTL